MFDEISKSLKKKKNPKTLRYQGVVGFGNDDISSTKNEALADNGLEFGLSTHYENYFQPVGCFATKGANGVTLSKLVVQTSYLSRQASNSNSILCDDSKPNRRVWKEFGITGVK